MNTEKNERRREAALEGIGQDRIWRTVRLYGRDVFFVRESLENLGHLDPSVDRLDEIGGPAGKHLLVLRDWKKEDTVIDIHGTKVGGDNPPAVTMGPCIGMSREQILRDLGLAREAGADFGRVGLRKPRESPYDDRGLIEAIGEEGFRYAAEAREKVGIAIVSECERISDIPLFFKYDLDVIQVGTNSAQNFPLLEAIARAIVKDAGRKKGRQKVVLLKRGKGCTVGEWLSAAEYLHALGVENVIMCERGVRRWDEAEKGVRYSFDKEGMREQMEKSHNPGGADPNHAEGERGRVLRLIDEITSDGKKQPSFWLIEASARPEELTCDSKQQLLLPEEGAEAIVKIKRAA